MLNLQDHLYKDVVWCRI